MTRSARALLALSLALSTAMVAGCGDNTIGQPGPTATPTVTPTPAQGPVITFIGLATASDFVIEPNSAIDGIDLYIRNAPLKGSGFRIVIEGKKGLSGADPGTSAYEQSPTELPDLQVIVSQALGNGSEAVCDVSGPNPEGTPIIGDGVPATDPPRFEPEGAVAAHVNDLSCRFIDGAGYPVGRDEPDDSCVKEQQTEDPVFVNSESEIQFCTLVDGSWPFLSGRTLVTARLRDEDGNVGPPAQIYVEVNPSQ